ncbi:MAG: peptide chain release factor-like protein [Planctomycetia bacterium]|nr:peptide chain release factor-like protein [Planctomycetia bacterium]
MSPRDAAFVHPACLDAEKLRQQCQTTRTRRTGPGGQHRNKVETAIVLLHVPSGVSAEASERRSQAENLAQAAFRLRVNLALAVRRPRERRTPASALWQGRVRQGRVAINPSHDDFPALLSEALDVLAAHNDDLRAAAADLACTPTQLVRFLALESRALSQLNARRRAHGLRPLR